MMMIPHESPCCINDHLCGEAAHEAASPHRGSEMQSFDDFFVTGPLCGESIS